MKDEVVADALRDRIKTENNYTVASSGFFNNTENRGQVKYWYYYSNQLPILHLANNDYRERHNITEHMVILTESDLAPKNALLRVILGLQLDYDFIMVNQVMFTFRRANGYMMNNSTQEKWQWAEEHYAEVLLDPKNDFQGNYIYWLLGTFQIKLGRLITVTLGFMTLSFVNGLVVRIALMCSNVVIFPLLWLIKTITGQ